LSGKSHPDVREVAERIVEESRGRKPGHRAAIRALVWQLMVLLHRLPGVGRQAAPPEQTGQGIGRVAPALEHLARHCADAISIPELAALCHMSVTNFRRVFRRATGQSPHPYLTNLRLQMASTLLSGTDRKVLDVSLTVGYVTLSSFNRHFRAAFGMTPLDWRRGRLLTSRTGKLTRSGQKKRQTGN